MGVPNANGEELVGKVPIRAYVSYRQKNPENHQAIQILEKQCTAHQIDLIYDAHSISKCNT
ncbi:MAG: hypothetical protein IPI97_10850 [Nitrosomonas sp.]|nr:hypothetical protein [Nitrosomonas sp.]